MQSSSFEDYGYAELDLTTDVGRARRKASSDFVRDAGVLDTWGRVDGTAYTEWKIGRQTGKWLPQLTEEAAKTFTGVSTGLGGVLWP